MSIRALACSVVALVCGCRDYFGGGDQPPGGNQPSSDAALPVDANPLPPPSCMPPTPLCGTAPVCGNNQIDNCFRQTMPGHCTYLGDQERCDGTVNVKSCTQLGFYGGTSVCIACAYTDSSDCDACAPGNTACVTLPKLDIEHGIAASGSRVALSAQHEVAIFEGTAEVARASTPYASGIVAIPGGWLVSMAWFPRTVAVLATDGTLGNEVEIPDNASFPLLAYAANRVLLAWRDADISTTPATWHVYIAILDAAGNTVVPTSDLFAITGGSRVSVTTDGTSFFVGSNGKLARIATDGTRTITSGFPIAPNTTEDYVSLAWSGTTGWYINSNGVSTQQFDATGAKVGGVLAIPGARTYVGDGNELIALRRDPVLTSKLQLIRIAESGALVASPQEVGVSDGSIEHLARVGGNIFVAWSRPSQLQVALVAP